MNNLFFLKSLNSPFKPFNVSFYFGRIAVGTPYFLPRRWRKFTTDEAIIAAHESMKDTKLVKHTFEEWVRIHKRMNKSVPKHFGFDFVPLGWKTKWSETDIRFEWAPLISFVFWKWQFVIFFNAPIDKDHYWPAWLYYEFHTDKNLSVYERVKQCRENFSLLCTIYKNGSKEAIDYYNFILKEKYLN
jgi:hypothetical protein